MEHPNIDGITRQFAASAHPEKIVPDPSCEACDGAGYLHSMVHDDESRDWVLRCDECQYRSKDDHATDDDAAFYAAGVEGKTVAYANPGGSRYFYPYLTESGERDMRDEQPSWLSRYGRGIEGSENWTVVIDGRTHALVRKPGRMYWSARGEQSYARTVYVIATKGKHCVTDSKMYSAIEGRLTKAMREQFAQRIAELDSKGGMS